MRNILFLIIIGVLIKLNTNEGHTSTVQRDIRRSDMKYKRSIVDVDDGLNTVLKLNPVYYYWDYESFDHNFDEIVSGQMDTRRQVGFIAQEVLEVQPNLVKKDSFGLVLDYVSVIPYLVQAIHNQQDQIDSLKQIINKK